MGEPVLMDSANDIEDFGLSEDLGKEGDTSVLCSRTLSLATFLLQIPSSPPLVPSWVLMSFRRHNGSQWHELG